MKKNTPEYLFRDPARAAERLREFLEKNRPARRLVSVLRFKRLQP